MGLRDEYSTIVKRLMNEIDSAEEEAIEKAADAIATTVNAGGVLHVFGAGHSHMLAEEIFYRAGGLVPVNAIFDSGLMPHSGAARSTLLERLPGYAAAIMGDHETSAGEPIVIVSYSGINPVPIEVALEARARSLVLIALTSVQASAAARPRHPSGHRLYELADIVLDNHAPPGDALVDVPGYPGLRTGPVSTILGAYILNNVIVRAVEKLAGMGQEPPVFTSANVPGSAERNAWLISHYRRQVKSF
ncbi:MAG: sugar isomerase domain-containing protein [Betaproteobacteria bacterium]